MVRKLSTSTHQNRIDKFVGPWSWLSNFYVNPKDGYCVEVEYQAAKATTREDAEYIRAAPGPGDAKKRGRKIKIRPDWESVKVSVMRSLLLVKFADQELLGMLIATGDAELIEGNWWGDQFWGVSHGVGENWLGKLLMEIRNDATKPTDDDIPY